MSADIFIRFWKHFIVAGTLCVLLVGVILSAKAQENTALVGVWDRLNPDQGNPSPEHEVLRCGGNDFWHCIYDKHPEPRLGFQQPSDSTSGLFLGKEITSQWNSPGWFPNDITENYTFVVGGAMTYTYPDGSIATINQDLIVTNMDGQAILYVFWSDMNFACPWFRSFDEALAANPFPVPFNGEDWPEMDCIFQK